MSQTCIWCGAYNKYDREPDEPLLYICGACFDWEYMPATRRLRKTLSEAVAEIERLQVTCADLRAAASSRAVATKTLYDERNALRAEVERLKAGEECHVARPGEGTLECTIHDGAVGCLKCERDTLRAKLDAVRAALKNDNRPSYLIFNDIRAIVNDKLGGE